MIAVLGADVLVELFAPNFQLAHCRAFFGVRPADENLACLTASPSQRQNSIKRRL